jgi:hypothetical protein
MRGGMSITVVRKPKADKLKPSPGPALRQLIDNCVVVPSQTFDTERGIWVTVDGYDVHCLAGATVTIGAADPRPMVVGDVLEDDQVEYEGKTWQVYGAPANLRNARGRLKDIVLKIRRVS